MRLVLTEELRRALEDLHLCLEFADPLVGSGQLGTFLRRNPLDLAEDDKSARASEALRAAAEWARTKPDAASILSTELRGLPVGGKTSWSEAQEYAFTTYCLEHIESRDEWLQRVRMAAD